MDKLIIISEDKLLTILKKNFATEQDAEETLQDIQDYAEITIRLGELIRQFTNPEATPKNKTNGNKGPGKN